MNVSVETEADLRDLMDQVLRVADYNVVMDLMLDRLEEDFGVYAFPQNCGQLIKQIKVRCNPPEVQDDSEEEEEE